ncbi:MAG TPA: DUF6541 family protein, partial [Aggregatilineales bacterium]|nr:DUF6541 family protein [Aggregatilineales bacterium]
LIDYLWFALLVGIFLAGTLSAGMFRSEAAGITDYGGWPGPRELGLFLMVAILFAAPALILPVPMDTDAQGFGYLALALKNSGSLTTLAPFHPEITYLYSPGLPALVAYLGHQLHAELQNIELAMGAVLSFLFVWLAYDFGSQQPRPDQRAYGKDDAQAALFGTGLLAADLDSHYSALLGLVFAMAFLIFAIRFHRDGRRTDFLAAAITLAGVPLAQPDLTIILALGYIPWLASMWLARPRPTFRRWLGLAVGIPALALVGVLPWLLRIAPLLSGDMQSPFAISLDHLLVMVAYHGGVIVILSAIGIVVAVRRRNPVDLLMVPWLALIVDFSSLGILKALFPGLLAPLLRYDYPFSIAWHGPIIPYIYLGGTGLAWLIDRIGRERFEQRIKAISLPLMNIIALCALLIMAFPDTFVSASKALPIQLYGTFSSKADVQAMEWLAQNTASDALILNYPAEEEGHWAPVVSQRNTVYFRPQPFFRGTAQSDAIQHALEAFWQNPADSANPDLLARYHVAYVLVPQIITRPDSMRDMFRWRLPLPDIWTYKPIKDVPYLKLVFDAEGAQVYQVLPRQLTF